MTWFVITAGKQTIKSSRNHVFKYSFAFFQRDKLSTFGRITKQLIGMFTKNMLSAIYKMTLIPVVLSRIVSQTKTRGTRMTLAQSQILMLNCQLE